MTAGPLLNYALNQNPATVGTGPGAITDTTNNTAGTLINAAVTPVQGAGATASTATSWNWTNGTNSSAASISVASNSYTQSIGNLSTTKGFSVGFWINHQYVATTSDNHRVTGLGTGTDILLDVNIGHAFTKGLLSFALGGSAISTDTKNGTVSVLDGRWHYVMATFNFANGVNNLNIYVDGVLNTSGTYNFTAGSLTPTTANLIIGARYSAGNPFVGSLDDYSLFDRAVSPIEVQELYAGNADPARFVPKSGIVDPGATRSGWINTAVGSTETTVIDTLAGAFTNANASDSLTYSWTEESGNFIGKPPVGPQFSDDNGSTWGSTGTKLNSQVRFTHDGLYSLKLTVTDTTTGQSDSADVTYTIYDLNDSKPYWDSNDPNFDPGFNYENDPAFASDVVANLNKNFGQQASVPKDFTGFNLEALGVTPAVNNHPRILFGSESAQTVANRLFGATATTVGTDLAKVIATAINTDTTSTTSPGVYAGTTTPLPSYSTLYNELLSGNDTTFKTIDPNAKNDGPEDLEYANIIGLTTYRLYYDYLSAIASSGPHLAADGKTDAVVDGQAAAVALAAEARAAYVGMMNSTNTKTGNDYQNIISEYTARNALAYGYDFGAASFMYNGKTVQFLNTTQGGTNDVDTTTHDSDQNDVRRALLAATSNPFCIGMDSLAALDANRGNWITNNDLYYITDSTAVEGESLTAGSTGAATVKYDPNGLPRVEAAYEKYFTYGVATDGAPDEGLGKNQEGAEAMLILGRHGDYLIASKAAKYQFTQFYLQSMDSAFNPAGNGGVSWPGFTWDTLDGGNFAPGRYNDPTVYKYLFPNDPVIDAVDRINLGSNGSYAGVSGDFSSQTVERVNTNFVYSLMGNLVTGAFALDPASYTQGQSIATVVSNLGTVYNQSTSQFFPSVGQFMARGDFSQNATRLYYDPRALMGGHIEADRSTIAVEGNNYNWLPYFSNNPQTNIAAFTSSSTLQVDNGGVGTVPVDPVSYTADNGVYTEVGTNNSLAYNYTQQHWTGTGFTNGPAAFTYNQSHSLAPISDAWANLTWSDVPDFNHSQFRLPGQSQYFSWDQNPLNAGGNIDGTSLPVSEYRTAGLVKGSHPFVVVTDDATDTVNGGKHTYGFYMAMNTSDTLGGSAAVSGAAASYVMNEPNDANNHLLVLLLNTPGNGTLNTPTMNDFTTYDASSHATVHPAQGFNLTLDQTALLQNQANGAHFRVVLVPYTGATVPVASVSATTSGSNTVDTITMGNGEVDTITFSPGAAGETDFAVKQQNVPLAPAAVKPAVGTTAAAPTSAAYAKPATNNLISQAPAVQTTSTGFTTLDLLSTKRKPIQGRYLKHSGEFLGVPRTMDGGK